MGDKSEEIALQEKTKGNACLAKNEYQQAVIHYTAAISLAPSNHALYSNRSAAHAYLEDYAAALQDANKCIELKPEWAKGYSRKGTAEFYLGNYKDGLTAYEQGLKLDPASEPCSTGITQCKAALETPNVSPMMMAQISAIKMMLVPQLQEMATRVNLPPMTGEFGSPVGNISYNVDGLKIHEFQIPQEEIKINVVGTQFSVVIPNVVAGIKDVKFSVRQCRLPHFKTSGKVNARASEIKFEIMVGVGMKLGSPSINITKNEVKIGKLDVKTHNSMASWVYNLFLKAVSSRIKTQLETVLQETLTSMFEGRTSALAQQS